MKTEGKGIDMKTPVITCSNVSFAYETIPVLESVSFTVEEHDFVSVVGPNGGGKSTLLKLILGLLRPAQGTIQVFGKSPRQACRHIGYTPQYMHHDPMFPVTVLDVALMGCVDRRWGGWYSQADRERALEALREVELDSVAHLPFSALSGGQRQRVLIARALATSPRLLLLDEPTSNVDAASGDRLLQTLSELNKRMTIIMVSHDLGFVSQVVKSVLCVNRRVFVHPTSDITGEMIQDIYGGDLRMVRHDHRCAAEGHSHV